MSEQTGKSKEVGVFKSCMEFLTAAVVAAIIFYSMALAANQVVSSQIYRQSRIVSMLVQQDTIGLSGMLEDTRNLEVVIKFAGALATAYINFEMIPLNETSTFVAVFESMTDDMNIDKFEYTRKDLVITGTAANESAYRGFIMRLRGRDYFASVSGSSYESTGGGVRFEIICVSDAMEVYLPI